MPTNIPSAPPAIASSRASTINCRTIARRPLPSAIRVAISLVRLPPRASSKAARLTHAISEHGGHRPTEHDDGIADASDERVLQRPHVERERDALRACRNNRNAGSVMVPSSLRACAHVAPGFSRTTSWKFVPLPSPVLEPRSGVQRSTPEMSWNPSGITPTTACGSPRSRIDLPTISGSARNTRRQRSWLRTVTAGPPARSSSAVNSRPRAGTTPSTRKNPRPRGADG